jgi:hypothetical protein
VSRADENSEERVTEQIKERIIVKEQDLFLLLGWMDGLMEILIIHGKLCFPAIAIVVRLLC